MISEIHQLFESIALEMENFACYYCHRDNAAVWISLSKIITPLDIANIFATHGKIVVLWNHDNWGATVFFYHIDIKKFATKARVLGLTHPKLEIDADVGEYDYTYIGLEDPKLDIVNEIKQFLGKPNEI